jgi:hypothetical protein
LYSNHPLVCVVTDLNDQHHVWLVEQQGKKSGMVLQICKDVPTKKLW